MKPSDRIYYGLQYYPSLDDIGTLFTNLTDRMAVVQNTDIVPLY